MTKPYNQIINTSAAVGNIYLGNRATALNTPLLLSLSVTHVLSALPPAQAVFPDLPLHNIQQLTISCYDLSRNNYIEKFNKSAEFIKNALEQGNVFVHCQYGISRSTSMLIAYFMKIKGWSYRESLRKIKQKRSQVGPNGELRY